MTEEISAVAPDFLGLVETVRRASQNSLVAAARARSDNDARLAELTADAQQAGSRFQPDQALLARYEEAWAAYGSDTEFAEPAEPGNLDEASVCWSRAVVACESALAQFRRDRHLYEAAQKKLFGRKPPPAVLGSSFGRELATLRVVAESAPDLRDVETRTAVDSARDELAKLFNDGQNIREAELRSTWERAAADASVALSLVGAAAFDWPAFLAATIDDEVPLRWLRLGELDVALPAGALPQLPCVVPFPLQRALAVRMDLSSRATALSLLRSVVLRALSSVAPGKLHLTIVDPVALGQSVADFLHLGDFDEELIDTKPWTSTRDIEAKLTELTAHLETVISKYLRGQHATIDEYNVEAGEMAEPYRLLLVNDFPANFSDRAAQQLLSLIENGPRCGVHTVISVGSEHVDVPSATIDRIVAATDVVSWVGEGRFRLTTGGRVSEVDTISDRCPEITFSSDGRPNSPAAKLLARIGASSRAAENEEVGYEHALPVLNRLIQSGLADRLPVLSDGSSLDHRDSATWWRANSTTGVAAPIGRAGAQAIASLYFSSTEIAGGALMVGLPRSGKTTALHAAILSMCMLYSPDELELYLIDAKHGVEFKAYESLPHARMVAINRDREFAVAVLESLDAEIARRAELMKQETPGRTNVEEYRRVTGRVLPRIVAIIDEFHEIFEEDDRLGQAAFAAFSNIVRQGPFAGVHMVVASQTLSSMPAMDRSTLTLLPGRVAFVCNESDANIVMGDANPDVKFLDRAGQGLLNPSRGYPAHNQRFQGIYVSPDHRDTLIRQLTERAVRAGWSRVPRVFDGDAVADRTRAEASAFFRRTEQSRRIEVLVGEPLSLYENVAVTLRRDVGENLLLAARADDDGVPDRGLIGVVHSVLAAASTQADTVDVVDFLNDEGSPPRDGDPGRASIEELCAAFGASFHRRRTLSTVVERLLSTVQERVALEDYRAASAVLLLYGIHRAVDLSPDEYGDVGPTVAEQLQTLLRDGPEVGVHTVLVADSASGLQRRIGSEALNHVGKRIVGLMPSEAERQTLLDAYQRVDLRPNQLLIYERDRDRRTKLAPYGPMSAEWLNLWQLETGLDEPGGPES